jgi:predicted N-formylglutamate amidohydrolase
MTAAAHGTDWVVSCEHGGHRVPAEWAALFAGQEALLASHRGWDRGARVLARQLAGAIGAPLHASTTTRLLVDLNRSIGHPQLFSEFTRGLPRRQREALIERHYRPHRAAVEGDIARRIAAGRRVVHIASHSFTPVWEGAVRRVDVAWLYDPRRPGECEFVNRWMAAMAAQAPRLALRRNNPYRGRGDGLTALLRKRHPDEVYAGIEIEVNQRFVERGGAAWQQLQADLVETLRSSCADDPGPPATGHGVRPGPDGAQPIGPRRPRP